MYCCACRKTIPKIHGVRLFDCNDCQGRLRFQCSKCQNLYAAFVGFYVHARSKCFKQSQSNDVESDTQASHENNVAEMQLCSTCGMMSDIQIGENAKHAENRQSMCNCFESQDYESNSRYFEQTTQDMFQAPEPSDTYGEHEQSLLNDGSEEYPVKSSSKDQGNKIK